jgi:hypothetical protein
VLLQLRVRALSSIRLYRILWQTRVFCMQKTSGLQASSSGLHTKAARCFQNYVISMACYAGSSRCIQRQGKTRLHPVQEVAALGIALSVGLAHPGVVLVALPALPGRLRDAVLHRAVQKIRTTMDSLLTFVEKGQWP